jgi:exodeoxyribonuclease VII small subunit
VREFTIINSRRKFLLVVNLGVSVPKFEDCLQQLEKIVEQLERGDLPLEQSLLLFEEGMKLSSACRHELESAEGKVEILLKQNGRMQAAPFDEKK